MKVSPCVLGVLVVALLLVAFALVGSSDYDDALLAEEVYCEGVASKSFPDYRGDYRTACINGKPRR